MPFCRTLQGSHRMFQYQLIIQDGIIDLSALEFRPAPCHCKVNRMTCNNNSDCAKNALLPELPDFKWTHKNF